MLAFPITTLSSSLPWKSRVQLGLRHHNASHIVSSSSSVSKLPESNLGKGKLRGNESFTVSYLMSSLGLPRNVATEISKKVELKDPNKPNSVLNLFRSYGFSDTHISILVKMYPRVLLSKPEKNLLPRLRFLQSLGISNSELQDLLISNIAFLKVSLNQCIIPCHETFKIYLDDDKEAIKAFKNLRLFRYCKSVANMAENIKVLRDIGVPQSSVSLLLTKFVHLALLDRTKFVEYVNFAREAGVDPSKIVFIKAISIIRPKRMAKIAGNIKVLRDIGVPQSSVSLMLTKFVHLVVLDHTKFVEYVNFAREAGVDPSKIMFIKAISVLSKLKKSTRNSKLDTFKRLGWTRDVTLSVFRKHPHCLVLSEENITKSMSFLVDEMGIPLTHIARNPSLLCSSLEGRIIPRYSVIKVLEMKGLLKRKPGFISIFTRTEEEFFEKYVTRFQASVPELLNIYEGA